MPISKKQKIAMAAIVSMGVLGGATVLMTERHRTGEEAEDPAASAGAASASAPQPSEKTEHETHAVKLDEAQIRRANIAIQPAGPGSIQSSSEFQGEVRFNEDRTAHVVPRLAGVAEAVPANLGETVKQGYGLRAIAMRTLERAFSALSLTASCIKPTPLQVLGDVPQFTLTSETGQPFDSHQLDGHIWIGQQNGNFAKHGLDAKIEPRRQR